MPGCGFGRIEGNEEVTLPKGLPALVALTITAVSGLSSAAITWGVTSNKIEVLTRAVESVQNDQVTSSSKLSTHDTAIAVQTQKLDDIITRLGRIEHKIDDKP